MIFRDLPFVLQSRICFIYFFHIKNGTSSNPPMDPSRGDRKPHRWGELRWYDDVLWDLLNLFFRFVSWLDFNKCNLISFCLNHPQDVWAILGPRICLSLWESYCLVLPGFAAPWYAANRSLKRHRRCFPALTKRRYKVHRHRFKFRFQCQQENGSFSNDWKWFSWLLQNQCFQQNPWRIHESNGKFVQWNGFLASKADIFPQRRRTTFFGEKTCGECYRNVMGMISVLHAFFCKKKLVNILANFIFLFFISGFWGEELKLKFFLIRGGVRVGMFWSRAFRAPRGQKCANGS